MYTVIDQYDIFCVQQKVNKLLHAMVKLKYAEAIPFFRFTHYWLGEMLPVVEKLCRQIVLPPQVSASQCLIIKICPSQKCQILSEAVSPCV